MVGAILSFIIGFFSAVVVAPYIIKLMTRLKVGQPILNYVESHYKKGGTPTMGGLIFIFGTIISFIFLGTDNIELSLIVFLSMIGYGILGFLDDFIKVKYKHNEGLKPYQKIIGQLGVSILVAFFAYNSEFVGSLVLVPFTNFSINLSWFIIPFVIFVFVAVSNSVNLIDGLDGLGGGVSLVYLIAFIVLLGIRVDKLIEDGESLLMINQLRSVMRLNSGVAGGILAFLLFNSNPAKIFMGDTGSLAIGGLISGSIVVTRMYLYMPLIGVMFVVTAFSVLLQVLYYKRTKKRIFLMAPLHHHFEKKGSNETKIVAIYIIISIIVSSIVILFEML